MVLLDPGAGSVSDDLSNDLRAGRRTRSGSTENSDGGGDDSLPYWYEGGREFIYDVGGNIEDMLSLEAPDNEADEGTFIERLGENVGSGVGDLFAEAGEGAGEGVDELLSNKFVLAIAGILGAWLLISVMDVID